MKKSVEILGLPVISITEGKELGMSKTLLIDAKNGLIAAITIEDEDWYRGVKLIPYESVIAIGDDAVTVTHSENILKLDEAGDYEALLDENIRVIGTKAITKNGTIQGKITELFIGDDGKIEKCEITAPDGTTSEVTADQISIFGKQVTVIDADTEKKTKPLNIKMPTAAVEPPPPVTDVPTADFATMDDMSEPVGESIPEPVVEPIPEPVAEPIPEPIAEPIPELIAEPMPEPVAEPIPEPIAEPIPEPIAEPIPEPIAEPIPEPVVESISEPVVEPIPEPIAEPIPEPVAEPIPEPVAESIPEPVVEPISEPVIEPMPEPVIESVSEPIVEQPTIEQATTQVELPISEPVTELMPEPIAEPIPESVAEPIPEPIAEPMPEPIAEPIPEPVAEPVPEPVAEPTPEPVVEPIPEPVAEPIPEPVAEPIPEPVAEPTSTPAVPEDDSQNVAMTQQAEALRAALKKAMTNQAKANAKAKAEKTAAAVETQKKQAADKATEERHRRFLLGKKATKTIKTDKGIVVVEAGADITEEVLQKARLANKFIELSMSVQ